MRDKEVDNRKETRLITQETLSRYIELNETRETETLAGWSERMTVWNNIRLHLFRDIKNGRVSECVLCLEPIDDSYVHDACLDEAVTYPKTIPREAERFAYGLYKFGRLVYIGITVNPRARFKEHLKGKNVDSMTVWASGSSEGIEALEKREIHRFFPPLNNLLHNADGSRLLARDMQVRQVSFLDVHAAREEITRAAEERAGQKVRTMRDLMQAEIDACRERIEFLEAQMVQETDSVPGVLEEAW
ncbi:GIY-YIG nuclease family protein [Streptomyces sp. C1-2]|uniref:GIY-YIG nuclease family protein n=1 Tax=Streptomyces sp. C1-2 TaxID=2720022 RepID=UPI0014326560|nr:GIY-YIG nuclease family protein [Streptomyces sp. C1-2]NJP72701.1 GIY-YIG nuclease family protein [Streptomyces sp. C1-2]